MKKTGIFLLILALFLSACSPVVTEAPQTEPTQTASALPEAQPQEDSTEAASDSSPAPEEPPVPAPDEKPTSEVLRPMEETPVPRPLPDPLPMPEEEPVYFYENDTGVTAVRPDGSVLLQVANASATLLTDKITGEPKGILVLPKGDYYIDGWANVYDRRATSTLYDLDGQFLMNLPSQHISAYGNLLWCGILVDENPRIYHYPTGQLLYADVAYTGSPGDGLLPITQGDQLLVLNTETNEAVFTLSGYENIYTSVEGYISATKDGIHYDFDQTGSVVRSWDTGRFIGIAQQEPLVYIQRIDRVYYLCDAEGQSITDHGYGYLDVLEDGLVQTAYMKEYQILDLSTGEVLFSSPYGEIEILDENYLVVPTENNGSEKYLMDWDGNVIAGKGCGYDIIKVDSRDEDGNPTMFAAWNWYNGSRDLITTRFLPDGTEVWTVTGNTGELTEDTATAGRSNEDNSVRKTWLLDRRTGAPLYSVQKSDLRCSAIDYSELGGVIREGRYVTISFREDDGETGWSVVHESGNVVIDYCRDLIYRGGGVIQCTKDGISGLLRLDGTWLYQSPDS